MSERDLRSMKTTNTHEVKIYIAGDLNTIEATCRNFCLSGLCVTVTPTNYIFTGGSETGACIGLINYARFPRLAPEITSLALDLARLLLEKCCQRSCSIVTPDETHYLENSTILVQR